MVQKPETREDLRVQRTRKLLRDALIALTVEQGFNAVTVRDITQRAQVNRSTFYRHYIDKHDLLDQYLNEIQALVSDAVFLAEKMDPDMTGKVPTGLLVLVKHVQANAAFYRIMLGQQGDPVFTQRFRKMSENRYRTLFSKFDPVDQETTAPLDMRLTYISCAAVGAILWWLENDQPYSAEQLTMWLGQLNSTSAGLSLKR